MQVQHPDRLEEAKNAGRTEVMNAMKQEGERKQMDNHMRQMQEEAVRGQDEAFAAGEQSGAEKTMVGLGAVQQPAQSNNSSEVEQLAQALASKQVSQEEVIQAAQNGQLDPNVAKSALEAVQGHNEAQVKQEASSLAQALQAGQITPEDVGPLVEKGQISQEAAQMVLGQQPQAPTSPEQQPQDPRAQLSPEQAQSSGVLA